MAFPAAGKNFAALATDLVSQPATGVTAAHTAMAARASSAVPVFVQPVNIAGRDCLDAGLVSLVPILSLPWMFPENHCRSSG